MIPILYLKIHKQKIVIKSNLQKHDLFHLPQPPIAPRSVFYGWFLQIRTQSGRIHYVLLCLFHPCDMQRSFPFRLVQRPDQLSYQHPHWE